MGETDRSVLPAFCRAEVLILGCGNALFGDDGFGCAVVEELEAHYGVPDDVCVLDTGTGVRKLLFTLCLSPVRPRTLVVVDAVDVGRAPGDLFDLDPRDIPFAKLDDFSLHQLPTSNLLRELQEACGVEVRVVACQTGPIPDHIEPGLSPAVAAAVPRAATLLAERYLGPCDGRHPARQRGALDFVLPGGD